MSLSFSYSPSVPWRYAGDGAPQPCVKYPDKIGFRTLLVGRYETYLSDKGRNLWLEFISNSKEWKELRTAETKLSAIYLQQSATDRDLSKAIMAREKVVQSKNDIVYQIAKTWAESGSIS